VAFEDREADLAQGLAQLAREKALVRGVAAQEAPEIAVLTRKLSSKAS
jgi:hypothetical protein